MQNQLRLDGNIEAILVSISGSRHFSFNKFCDLNFCLFLFILMRYPWTLSYINKPHTPKELSVQYHLTSDQQSYVRFTNSLIKLARLAGHKTGLSLKATQKAKKMPISS